MRQVSESLKGYLQIIITVTLWAFTSSLMVRLIDHPPQVILSFACLAATIFFLGKLKIQNRFSELRIQKKHLLWLIFGVGAAQGINVFLFWSAVKTTTIANANFSHYFAPVIVALIFAPLILKEPIKLQTVIASMGGLVGLSFIFLFGSPLCLIDFGTLFGLASAVFFAILTVSERKLAITGTISPEVDTIFKAGMPALIFLPWAIIQIVQSSITFYAIGMIVALGLVQQGLCNFLLFRGLKVIPARRASYLMYGEPMIAALLIGPIFLGEHLDLLIVLGGCLIIGAGILIARASKSLLERMNKRIIEILTNLAENHEGEILVLSSLGPPVLGIILVVLTQNTIFALICYCLWLSVLFGILYRASRSWLSGLSLFLLFSVMFFVLPLVIRSPAEMTEVGSSIYNNFIPDPISSGYVGIVVGLPSILALSFFIIGVRLRENSSKENNDSKE